MENLSCDDIEICPFCSCTSAHLLKANTAFGDKLTNEMYHVACEGCAAFGPLKETQKEAINIWNDISRIIWK